MLSGKTAIITGGSKGIGYATALELVKNGCSVVISSRNKEDLQKAEQAIRNQISSHGRIISLPCDVTHPDSVDSLINFTQEHFQKIDFLVNNAGIAVISPLDSCRLDLFDKVMNTNLRGAYCVMTKIANNMVKQGYGHIINVGSVASKETFPEWGIYCASKFGLLALTKTLAQEMRTKGIKVTSILPGAVDTPIWESVSMDVSRTFMLNPEDVAKSIFFTLSQSDNTSIDEIQLTPKLGLL